MTSDESTNFWVDAPYNDRIPSLSPYRQYSSARLSFPRPDEFSRLGIPFSQECPAEIIGGEHHIMRKVNVEGYVRFSWESPRTMFAGDGARWPGFQRKACTRRFVAASGTPRLSRARLRQAPSWTRGQRSDRKGRRHPTVRHGACRCAGSTRHAQPFSRGASVVICQCCCRSSLDLGL